MLVCKDKRKPLGLLQNAGNRAFLSFAGAVAITHEIIVDSEILLFL